MGLMAVGLVLVPSAGHRICLQPVLVLPLLDSLHCGLQASTFLLPACVCLLLLPAMDSEFISHPLSSLRLLEEPLSSHGQVSLPHD